MSTLRYSMLCAGLVCLALSAFRIDSPKFNLEAAGLALWLLAELLR
jgi:hypothetical protein